MQWPEWASVLWGGMTDVDADGGGSVKGAWDMVRVICKRKSKQKLWLPREFGFSSDVSASATLKIRVRMCRN